MPLADFFQKQFDSIKAFMGNPRKTVRCVRVDPELKEMFLKALVKMEEDPDFPHFMIHSDAPYHDTEQYFTSLYNSLDKQLDQYEAELESAGIRVRGRGNRGGSDDMAESFLRMVTGFADNLPDHAGAMVFVMDPQSVSDAEGYYDAVTRMATQTPSAWVKYLVIDHRLDPLLAGIDRRTECAGHQTFYLAPAEIEARVKSAADEPHRYTRPEQRQHLALLAGFAFGRKAYEEAAELHQRAHEIALDEGAPQPVANIKYNLGNTRLAQGELEAAETLFCEAIELCLDNRIDALLPLVLVNLGVVLHRQQRVEEAAQSFQVARENFKAQNQLPGEAHALDCLVSMHQAEKQYDRAEEAWRECLALYNGITSDAFEDVRRAGAADIRQKLERLRATQNTKG